MSDSNPLPAPALVARLGDRGLFPRLEWAHYLNHAAISPPSEAVLAAVAGALGRYAARGVSAYPAGHGQRLRLKERIARLLGGRAQDWALVLNTGAGLTAVAQCLRWRPGDTILLFEGEFPTNVTPWQRAAARFGLGLEWLSLDPLAAPGGADLGPLETRLRRGGVRLVALSAVQFQTGLRAPLAEIARLCRAAGARLSVDGIQACGGVPLEATDCDFLAVGGHKWLMGPEGAGLLYVNPAALDDLEPWLASWLSHEGAADFLFEPGKLRYDKPFRPDIGFLEGGAPNAAGYAGLEAAVAAIEQIGVAPIFAHVSRWLDALAPTLDALGFQSHRLPEPERRSGILAALPPQGLSAAAIAAGLAARGVAVTTPDGRVRFAPHWPNALEEVAPVAAALTEVVQGLRR